ncbi:tRNA splicing endonuclease 54 [Dermatophagoides farinae]|uniref:tRNA splicing endonuclease 54 n=2 Tax=Dermatophagoides farinae TaxID=6954 RepID=A0A922L1B3_DERFA|nr:tRNA splicing endonuclease 54 [Dermatophagoides farinae]
MEIETTDESKSNQNERDFFYVRVPNDDKSDVSDNDDEQLNQELDDEEKEIDFNALLEQLNGKYSKIRNDLSVLVDKKNVTKGDWNSEKRVVQINGKDYLKQYTPNARCLTPFEALFLFECRSLAIYYQNILLSIEDAYELLLQDNRDVKLYKIFSTLSRIGFFVVQQIVSKPENSEIENKKEPKSQGIKRSMIDDDQEIESKKIITSNNGNSSTSNDNFAIITSIQPLQMENISKLNKMDKELIQHFKSKDDLDDESSSSSSTSSYLYCVKKAARPAQLSQLIRPLYSEKHKPLIPLGSIFDTDSLFRSIQQYAPICFDNHDSKSMLNIDFNIYQSQANKKQNHKPLFSVIVVDEDQPPPSIEEIGNFRALNIRNGPILFALLAQFTFNFYSFETFIAQNKYPRLWEQFYHHHYHHHHHHQRGRRIF